MTTDKITIDDLMMPIMNEHVRYIGTVLYCHLLVEQFLYELLDHACRQSNTPLAPFGKITFAKLVDRCEREPIRIKGAAKPIISADLGDALRKLNNLRISMAHTINFEPSYKAMHDIAHDLGKAGVDFTDDMDTSEEIAREYGYDELGLLEEAVKHLLFDLGFMLAEAGGRDVI